MLLMPRIPARERKLIKILPIPHLDIFRYLPIPHLDIFRYLLIPHLDIFRYLPIPHLDIFRYLPIPHLDIFRYLPIPHLDIFRYLPIPHLDIFRYLPIPHLDIFGCLKAIQLIEELQHGPLHLRVSSAPGLNSGGANGVDFVHEDDGRSVFSGHHEQLPYHPGALSDELLDQFGARHSNESTVGVMGHGTGQESLSCKHGQSNM